MRNAGKRNVIGILIDAVDYDGALEAIFDAAGRRKGFAVSALAVHGVMTGVLSGVHKYRLNHFDLLAPDGQPVRWILNWVHRANLPDRVYGPNLTLKVCERAAEEHVPVYLYGSTREILDDLVRSLTSKYPGLRIAGCEASKFRPLTQPERDALVSRIRNSGAAITLVGLGCPRQETFAYETARGGLYADPRNWRGLSISGGTDTAGTTLDAGSRTRVAVQASQRTAQVMEAIPLSQSGICRSRDDSMA